MFTIEEIQKAEQKIKTGADFPEFAASLKKMGITRCDVYVINGMSTYFGSGDKTLQGPPAYEDLLIEEESSVEELKEALKVHQIKTIDYQTFCRQAAGAGVEKWIIDLSAMTVTYLDMSGNELIVENISI
jgi:uncharacterized protein YbcV (DUF1398 family)